MILFKKSDVCISILFELFLDIFRIFAQKYIHQKFILSQNAKWQNRYYNSAENHQKFIFNSYKTFFIIQVIRKGKK